jgi:polyisoprenyl-phosphate glycosyltransferase
MVSIIFLSYFSGERINRAYEKLSLLLNKNGIPFEFIVIDDGSSDNSFQIALELASKHSDVKAFRLSRNFSAHYSIFAGLSVCKGECAIPIDDDEQHPFEMIIDVYKLWEEGHKIIIPFRNKRDDGIFNNFFANAYYKIINSLSDIKFPKGGADTFLIDREIIDIINSKIHPINTSSIVEVLRLGFDPCYYSYDRPQGINDKSRWTLKKKLRLFKDTFFSSSTWPIKMITRIGFLFSSVAFGLILLYTYVAFFGNPAFWGQKLPGWTSTVVIISFFSGIILFSLGIIAEYIWRIYEEVKDRPGFIIKQNPGKDKDK